MRAQVHISDQTILLALDGELSPREAAKVRTHLEACWTCRARREAIQKTINDFVDFKSDVVSQYLPRPSAGRTLFISRLDQLIERTSSPSLLQRLGMMLWASRWQTAVVAAALTLAIVAAWILREPRIVSANELLLRAESAQASDLARQSNAVVFRKIRIRSGHDAITRTIYASKAKPRPVDRQEGAGGTAIQLAYLRSGLDWEDPLSARDLRMWRSQLSEKNDEVRRSSDGLLTLVTSTSTGPVRQAQFVVRENDWHPVEERLAFVDSTSLEITQLDYNVVSKASLDPAIFGPIERPETPAVPHVPAQPVEPPAITVSLRDLVVSELEALIALHQAKADVSEQIGITRSNGDVMVRGLVRTSALKQELIATLARIPHVHSDLQTLDEAEAQQPPGPALPAGNPAAISSPAAGPPLLQHALELQFPNVQDRSRFIDQALEKAQDALAHTAALRNLAARFGPAEVAQLNADSRRDLTSLVQDHLSVLREELMTERTLVSAIAPVASEPPALPISTTDWRATTQEIFREVRKVQSSAIALFGSSQRDARLSAEVAQLHTAIIQTDALSNTLAEQAASQVLNLAREPR